MDRTISNASQLSAIVKGRRKELNVSQADAGALMSVTQGRYSQLESQIDELSFGRVLVLLRHLGLEMVVREAGGGEANDSTPSEAAAASAHKFTLTHQKFKVGSAIASLPTLGSISKKVSPGMVVTTVQIPNTVKLPSDKNKVPRPPKVPPKGGW